MRTESIPILLSHLKQGDRAVVVELNNSDVSLKLMEFGILPGEEIEVEYVAPFGDPISYKLSHFILALRKAEAQQVRVKKIDEK